MDYQDSNDKDSDATSVTINKKIDMYSINFNGHQATVSTLSFVENQNLIQIQSR